MDSLGRQGNACYSTEKQKKQKCEQLTVSERRQTLFLSNSIVSCQCHFILKLFTGYQCEMPVPLLRSCCLLTGSYDLKELSSIFGLLY